LYNFKVLLGNIKYLQHCSAVSLNVKKKLFKLWKSVLKKPGIYANIIINYLRIKMKHTFQLFLKHQNF